MTAPTPASDHTVAEVIAEATRSLEAAHPGLARSVSRVLAAGIDELDGDPQLVELLDASVEGNITTILLMLGNDIPVDELQPTTAAVEYAVRLAQRGVPAAALMRAYHMGQDQFRVQITEQIQLLAHPPELRLQAAVHVSTLLYRYIDRVTQYVLAAYEDERHRWVSTRGTVASSLVHAVLAGQPVDPATFGADTGYRLQQRHLAVVLWTTKTSSGPEEQQELEAALRRIAALAGAIGAPLATAVDRVTAWGWLPFGGTRRPPDLTAVRKWVAGQPALRLSTGLPMVGERGFRRSHEQAQEARRIALAVPGRVVPPVTGYDDSGVAVAALLARNAELTGIWVGEVLGDLAHNDPGTEQLRETMRVFLMTGESYQRTAELLTVHRNTVKYRVGKVLSGRRADLEHDRLDLALALQVCHLLGPVLLLANSAVPPRRQADPERDRRIPGHPAPG